jgi:hypothetical protein
VNDHRDESLMDKVKNAFGMGSHDDDHDHIDDADTTRAEVPGRTTFDDDDLSDSGNRPAGPDYGAGTTLDAGDTVDSGFGTADRVNTADSGFGTADPVDTVETVEVDYGPPPTTAAAGTEFGTGIDRGPTTMPDESEWTRGGAASGESALDAEEDLDVDRRDPLV